MTDSPIVEFLQAIDKLDVQAAASLFVAEGRLLIVDGHRAEGLVEVREVLEEFLGAVRSTSHTLTGQWRDGQVWIAEAVATYQFQDGVQIGPLPRALVLRDSPEGILELHVYGSNERPLAERDYERTGMHVGGRWLPAL